MAEAIAKHLAADVIDASSAGLVPFGEIPSTTLAALAERGFSAEGGGVGTMGGEARCAAVDDG